MHEDVQFYIGCSGYYNRHWKVIFYPEKMPPAQWLNFYSEKLNTLELNSTFYKFPTVKGLQSWFSKSPDNFVFSVKASKLITHLKKFNDCKTLVDDFYLTCSSGLRHKLGCILFQLPPSFNFTEERLQLILTNLDLGFRNVVEFRHKSWWVKRAYNELAKRNITFCTVSYPGLPGNIIANTSTIYIRLHGIPEIFYSDYPEEQLQQLYKTISNKKGIRKVYIYFNNTAGTAGILNAQLLTKIIGQ